jgi:hypothetical protein
VVVYLAVSLGINKEEIKSFRSVLSRKKIKRIKES